MSKAILRFDLNLTQNTPVGMDSSGTTKIYVRQWRFDDTVYISREKNPGVSDSDLRLVAVYTIHHPDVMCGTWDDCESLFTRSVIRDLEDRGLIEENDSGTKFWHVPFAKKEDQ